MLSDKINAVTKAIGVEPCGSCQKRAEKLDEWQRRGFIKTGALALLTLKNSTLKAAYQVAGRAVPAGLQEALSLVRQINTAQAVWHEKYGKHGSRDEILTNIATHLEHNKPGTPGYAWLSRLTPLATEVLPGWSLDYASITAGYPRPANPEIQDWVVNDGYRLVLAGEKYTIATDEAGVVYQVRTPETLPRAAGLERAADFPDAVPYNKFVEGDSAWNRVKRFLTPVAVVYAAQAQHCCARSDCAYGCGCASCVNNCCVGCGCSTEPLGGYCLYNGGCDDGCTWMYSACAVKNCQCCVNIMWPGGCCMTNVCAFGSQFCSPC